MLKPKEHTMNDKTDTKENRLGEVRDIKYVLNKAGIYSDMMILEMDNLFEFALAIGTAYDSNEFAYLNAKTQGTLGEGTKSGTIRDIELYFHPVNEGVKNLRFEGKLFQMGYYSDRII